MWKESEVVELKESLNADGILEAVCAFANGHGGTIYVGISDDGRIKGITIGKNTLENLANDISRNLDPSIGGVGIEILTADNKQVLKITVPVSSVRPHFYHRKAYCRIGKTNQTLSAAQLEAIYAKKLLGTHGIDIQILEEATEDDINEESLKKYAKEIGLMYRGKIHALRSLNLVEDGRLRAAAILFFGTAPERFFPLYGFKCGVMSGNEIIEMSDIRENIYESVDRAVGFILRNIPSSFKIEGLRRIELPRIPREVIREAIVNAAIHRDYSIGSGIFIQIDRNSVTIKNPGVLPLTISIKDLYKIHHSEPRNKLLAELAFKVKLIEQWGMGTVKIVNGMRLNGLDDPIFLENKGYFEAILPISAPKFNERQKAILKTVSSREKDISLLIKELKTSERSVRTDLDSLVKKGFVKKERHGRKFFYHI